jgi:hypothetical protein
MQSRAVVLFLCSAVLSACTGIPSMPSLSINLPSFNFPRFNSPGTPIQVESIPPGAEANIADGPSCKTPCTLAAPPGSGTYNVSFVLEGYESQTVPVRVAIGPINTWQASESGALSPSPTVIESAPVVAELAPTMKAAAPKAKMPPPKAKKLPPQDRRKPTSIRQRDLKQHLASSRISRALNPSTCNRDSVHRPASSWSGTTVPRVRVRTSGSKGH